jgi:hypothetical protein
VLNTTTISGPVSPAFFAAEEYVRRGLKKRKSAGAAKRGTRLALYPRMRVTGPFEIAVRERPKAFGAAARCVEKTSPSSGLGNKSGKLDANPDKLARPLQVELVCQDDTRRFDQFWDSPRLVPTFVTQVMAQAMPERRQSVSVETAYGSARTPRMALLLDRKS